jgi:DNA (cytosine-5)-methyltransferase 1
VREYDFRRHAGIDLVAAGAPCQPWSLGGKHQGYEDDRNLFPQVFRAAREILPKAVIVENVKGILRTAFHDYFEYILLALNAPEMKARKSEDWVSHARRLEKAVMSDKVDGARYRVSFEKIDAANFGVAQRRHRVFIVAIREDLGVEWKPLRATHSEDALLVSKWVDGTYWQEHGIKTQRVPERLKGRIARLRDQSGDIFRMQRWQTVRDALRGLPEPKDFEEHPRLLNHVGNPGARTYPGHTGSPYDEPAKALKAGDHGVPGGENMLRREDGSVRYFTVREAARLQGFPDTYHFAGPWTEGFRQLGNAVPVGLARVVALRLRQLLQPEIARSANRAQHLVGIPAEVVAAHVA